MGGERLLMKNHLWKGSKEQRHGRQLHTEVQRAKWSRNTNERVRHPHVRSTRFSSEDSNSTHYSSSKLMFVHKMFTLFLKMSQLENLQTQEVLL